MRDQKADAGWENDGTKTGDKKLNGPFVQKLILVIMTLGIPAALGAIWWAGRTSAKAEVMQEQVQKDVAEVEVDIDKLLEISHQQSRSITELKTIQQQHLQHHRTTHD